MQSADADQGAESVLAGAIAEEVQNMQSRYQAALTPVYEDGMIASGRQPPPTDLKHVFDWPDGLRLQVIRHRTIDHGLVVHFSASATGALRDALERLYRDEARPFLLLAVERWRELSGDQRQVHWMGFSRTGVPHWYVIEES